MSQVATLFYETASSWFEELPENRRIPTLSPEYVVADAARDTDIEAVFLGYREGDDFWLYGVHRRWVPEVSLWDIQSPYGYGGPVSNTNNLDFIIRAWDSYKKWCKQNGIMVEFVRLHPLANQWQHYQGEVCANRTAVVTLLKGDDVGADYSSRCKRSIKKAGKASADILVLPNSDIVDKFSNFYRQGMKTLEADEFYLFSDEYFLALSKMRSVNLIVSAIDGEWCSAAIFLCGPKNAEYHLGVSSALGKKYAMSALLHHKIAIIAKTLGNESYYLGGGTDAATDNSLLLFKSGFSPYKLTFHYGYYVHDMDSYSKLKDAKLKSGSNTSRVIFYR